jgi:hypothetical protein
LYFVLPQRRFLRFSTSAARQLAGRNRREQKNKSATQFWGSAILKAPDRREKKKLYASMLASEAIIDSFRASRKDKA